MSGFKGFPALRFAVALAGCALYAGTRYAQASIDTTRSVGVPLIKTVRSMKDIRYNHIVNQQFDYSCGAAALATLLKFGCAIDTPETGLIRRMMVFSTPEVVVKNDFSMLDMKKFVETIGLRGRGFRVNTEALRHLQIPVMVLMNIDGYEHFVIVKHAKDGRVFIADPAPGNRIVLEEYFARSWNGLVFAVLGKPFREDSPLLQDNESLALKLRASALANGTAATPFDQTGKYAGAAMISGFVLNVISQWQLPNGANALAQGTLTAVQNATGQLASTVNTLARVNDGGVGNAEANPHAQANGGQSISVNGVSQVMQVAGDRNIGANSALVDFNNNAVSPASTANAPSAAASNSTGSIKAGISFGSNGVSVALQTPAGLATQAITPGNGQIAQLLQIACNNQQVANQLQLHLQTQQMSAAMIHQLGVLQALQCQPYEVERA